jgi:hypothetical protein
MRLPLGAATPTMTLPLEIHSNKALLTSNVVSFNPKSKIQNPKSKIGAQRTIPMIAIDRHIVVEFTKFE